MEWEKMMRMPDPSSDAAAARLDNANPKLHQTVEKRQSSDLDWEDSIPGTIKYKTAFRLQLFDTNTSTSTRYLCIFNI